MTALTDPWMPLYIKDYRADTHHLSAELHGVYLLLLMDCWIRKGKLPNDPEELARIAAVSVQRWKQILPKIIPFFQISDDGWRHKRVTKELARAVEVTEKRVSAGKAGADARWQTHAGANGKRMPDA